MPENNDTILTLLLLSLNILLICTVWYSFLGEFASQTVFLCVVLKVDDALILCLLFFFLQTNKWVDQTASLAHSIEGLY